MLSPTALFVTFATIAICQANQISYQVSEELLTQSFQGSSLTPLKKSVISMMDNIISSIRSRFTSAINNSIEVPRTRLNYRSATMDCTIFLHHTTLRNLQSIARAGDVKFNVSGPDLYINVPLKFGYLKYFSDYKIKVASRRGPHGRAQANITQTLVTAKFSINSIDGYLELENINVTSPGNIKFLFNPTNWLTNIVRTLVANRLKDSITESIERILDYFVDYTLADASKAQYRLIV